MRVELFRYVELTTDLFILWIIVGWSCALHKINLHVVSQDLMKYDPQQRPTASQTLQYPFFQVITVACVSWSLMYSNGLTELKWRKSIGDRFGGVMVMHVAARPSDGGSRDYIWYSLMPPTVFRWMRPCHLPSLWASPRLPHSLAGRCSDRKTAQIMCRGPWQRYNKIHIVL